MKLKRIIIILLLFISGYLSGQKDTVIIHETEEETVKDEYDIIYNYTAQENKTIDHFWKVDLINYGKLAPNIGYEAKIGNRFSLNSYILINFDSTFFYPASNLGFRFETDFKYYHNLKRPENRGVNINGFVGNYISAGIFYAGQGKILNQNFPYGMGFSGNEFTENYLAGYGLTVKYGIQRRIGSAGFIEPFCALDIYKGNYNNLRKISFRPYIGLKAGFSIESIIDLKRKLRN
ncbi:MAG: hypothetical protein JXB17_10375 [Bacteroidales bacterium]|nr:hypothetical protein [Bacteroidales bacterium]